MADDPYGDVIGGKLSLKSKGLFGSKKKKSGKKKKRKRDNEEGEEASEGGRKEDKQAKADEGVDLDQFLTPAQRRFKEQTQIKNEEKIKDMVKKTHKERVEEFNHTLSTMTEHNDIPRVSAAGNG